MARTRDADDSENEPEERPRRRPKDEEEDEPEEGPRRRKRPRDDDDDDDRPSSGALGPLDKTFRDTSIVMLILFALCCRGIAFILSLICLITAKDSKAKTNALVVLVIDGLLTVLLIALRVTGQLKLG